MRKRAGLFILLASALCFPETELRAEGVKIEGDNPRQSIKLILDAATTGDALQAIHQKFGVEIIGGESIAGDGAITTVYNGTLTRVVGRLLRNQNFVIVHSSKNITGVEKIQISGTSHATDPKNAPKSAAPQSAMP